MNSAASRAGGRREQHLDGLTAIVTGAGSRDGASLDNLGIGAATAITLASVGAHVALVDNDFDALQRTLTMIDSATTAINADVTTVEGCAHVARSVQAEPRRTGILVNNVGIVGQRGSVTENTLEHWEHTLRVNLTSVALMCSAIIPLMIAGGGGSIVNISSIGAIRALGNAGYASSKGAILSLTSSLAFSHGRDGIRVNAVLPGHLATPMANGMGADAARRDAASMLGITGSPWDAADAVEFLAGPRARFLTAVALPVDGGASMVAPLAIYPFLTAASNG